MLLVCYTANRIQVLLKEQNHCTKTILASVFCDNLRVSELKSWTHCSSRLHNIRVNTFGDSQSSNFYPTPHLTTYHLKKKTWPNLDYLAHLLGKVPPRSLPNQLGTAQWTDTRRKFLFKKKTSLWYPSALRFLQQSLTWHGVSSQVSHTLKKLTSTTSQTKQFCKLSQKQTRYQDPDTTQSEANFSRI